MNTRTSKPAMDEAINSAHIAERSLSDMRLNVSRRSETITAAGFGLCALANLLGADASDHFVDHDLKYGLANAVLAIGELLKETGASLWENSGEGRK